MRHGQLDTQTEGLVEVRLEPLEDEHSRELIEEFRARVPTAELPAE